MDNNDNDLFTKISKSTKKEAILLLSNKNNNNNNIYDDYRSKDEIDDDKFDYVFVSTTGSSTKRISLLDHKKNIIQGNNANKNDNNTSNNKYLLFS